MTMRVIFWRSAGAPLLLVISLYGLYGHVAEREHRHEIIAHGREAEARVLMSAGAESVLIEWDDSSGTRKMAATWTGKPFARLARPGQGVAIKYDTASALEPVILSEVAERDRVNDWWINANIAMAVAMTIVCVVIGALMLAGARAR